MANRGIHNLKAGSLAPERTVRAATLVERQMDYVQAARLGREWLPQSGTSQAGGT